MALLIPVLAVAFGLPGRGQTTGGSLQGRVVDLAGQPIAGAQIQVSGPNVQGFLGAATNLDGVYLFPYVPAGRGYEVKAEAEGYATVVRKGIAIPLGARVDLPFTMAEGKTEVVVTVAAPLVDLKSTKTGATLSSRMIEALPLQRDSSQIVFLAPTAVDSGSSTPGMASIGGSTGAENTYIVNGMDVTNTNVGTGTGATFDNRVQVVAGGLVGSMLNFDFIQEEQVMTGGVPPEYGQGMGGIVNAITRSGGNEFHGGLFAYYWSDSLQAQSTTYTYDPTIFGNAGFTRYDVGGDVSGYFVKDKLWFYLGYDYNRMKDYTVVPGGPEFGDLTLYLNGRPAQSASVGQHITDTSEVNQQYAFKLTWNLSPNHKLSLTLFGDHDKVDTLGTLNTLAPESQPYTRKTQPTNVSLQWNATWTPRFFTEAVVSYHDSTQKVTLTPVGADNLAYQYYFTGFYALPKDQTVPPVSADPNTLVLDLGSNYQPSLGFGGYSAVDKDTSLQLRAKFTNLVGKHELSYGLQVDDRDYTPRSGLSGPHDFVSPGSGMTATGLGVPQWLPAEWYGFPVGPEGQQYVYWEGETFTALAHPAAMRTGAAWINDNWAVTQYFTLKLGLRYDEEKMEGKLPGAEAINLTDNWAPRLGFTWDVAHNGKSKLFGYAGRYFQRIPTDMAVRALNNYQSGWDFFYDPQLTVWTGASKVWGGATAVQGQSPGLAVNSPLKAPYTDEYILGFEYEVRPNLRLGVRGIYRCLGQMIEDFSYDGGFRYIIGNIGDWTHVPMPGLMPDGQTPDWNQIYYFPKPTRIYRALEITAEKRFSHNWQMGASYVLSRLEGNYEGESQNDTFFGQLDPSINAVFDLPQLLVNGSGLLPLDRTHVLKVYGSYQFSDIPLELSANFLLMSGTPISKQVTLWWYIGGVGFADTRGSNGRTPTTWSLDLSVQYTFNLPMKSYLGVRLDVFNVTNNQVATGVYQTWAVQPFSGAPLIPFNTLWNKPYQHQAPRLARLGLRWTF